MSYFWSKEHTAVLIQHWGKGKSAAEIGKLIGRNKNQVIGRAHRLGLTAPKTESRGPKKFNRAKRPVPRGPRNMFFGVSGCQWIDGEPRERSFCGEPTIPESSYCDHHHDRCWVKHSDYVSEAA